MLVLGKQKTQERGMALAEGLLRIKSRNHLRQVLLDIFSESELAWAERRWLVAVELAKAPPPTYLEISETVGCAVSVVIRMASTLRHSSVLREYLSNQVGRNCD